MRFEFRLCTVLCAALSLGCGNGAPASAGHASGAGGTQEAGSGGATGSGGAAGSGGGPSLPAPMFRRVELTQTFYAEGASYGDFDRDGENDVVAGPYWYAGPDFTQKHEIYAPHPFQGDKEYSDNFFAFPRDFNADGWLDVLFVGFPGKEAYWHENPKKNDAPWPRHVVFAPVDGESPSFVDLTGDGNPELVCASGGKMGWAEPDLRDPTKPWVFHAMSADEGYGAFAHGLGVGDLDGDGRSDLLEVKGDVNGDGRADVVVANKKGAFVFLQELPGA